MDNMTSLEAYERTLKCLEKGKKGVVAVFRSEDGTLTFGAPSFQQRIVRLDIRLDSQVMTEENFDGLLVMRSNPDKAEHWVTLFEVPSEDSMSAELRFKRSSLTDPFEFTCSIVMENKKQLHRDENDTDPKWLTYRMYLYGADGAAALVQDDGTAQLTLLESSIARQKSAPAVRCVERGGDDDDARNN